MLVSIYKNKLAYQKVNPHHIRFRAIGKTHLRNGYHAEYKGYERQTAYHAIRTPEDINERNLTGRAGK